jgi:OTU domain-containing protein 6
MSDTEENPLELLQSKHKQEKKSLIHEITGLKKRINKKNKKEVMAEIETKQQELDTRHKMELLNLESDQLKQVSALKSDATDNLKDQDDQNDQNDTLESENFSKKKKNRQKLRLEKRKQELEQLQEEARKESEGTINKREVENHAIEKIIDPLNLSIHEIIADGHCLFRAISDQIHLISDQVLVRISKIIQ